MRVSRRNNRSSLVRRRRILMILLSISIIFLSLAGLKVMLLKKDGTDIDVNLRQPSDNADISGSTPTDTNTDINIDEEPNIIHDSGTIIDEPELGIATNEKIAQNEDNITNGNVVSDVDRTLFFKDSVFIGDSRVEGLMLFSGINSGEYIWSRGLNLHELYSKGNSFNKNGDKDYVLSHLRKANHGKVFLSLGLSELGWFTPEKFITEYLKFIDKVREIQPDAEIYVQSIIPLADENVKNVKTFNNSAVAKFNTAIEQMCIDNSINFIDVGGILSNNTGKISPEIAKDGIHFSKDYYKKWADIIVNEIV